MIMPHEEIAWVLRGEGTRIPFDAAELARSIAASTDEPGLLAESIAAAVEQYARDHQPERLLTTVEIAEMVEAVLDMLGMEELADAYAGRHPDSDIALDQMTGGYELAFYRQLDVALDAAIGRRGRVVRLRGLRDCVLRLRGTRRWGEGCRRLSEEIVQYVYARTARLRGTAVCSVSVVE